ncbi:MAG: sodium ion-translocating decarboxylase subunit beta [Lentisphaerae bacterium]|nr:sodium ion-translocating decarboxylase subunit beta [Lentisphaerota bacterium]MBT4821918.1 sodium ion-translocating decarboxylase subunit beta [Lentisphaerota bacterium]MBT5608794.1 sodium ion-translocating decarboxylase subunit beta [Lentisphaerota bacterium]MBT7058305.1 sodium ion-translocating decarboxylase subunit beta [Lentisphaerota bacterium]MBT7840280.1 sodium ion-translocating decarboxylase subunit beta [Lentisphaerota bacterium]
MCLAAASFGSAGSATPSTDVFRLDPQVDGTVAVRYVWPDPATVYGVSAEPNQLVRPGRELCVLKFTQKDAPRRSKAHLEAGQTYRVKAVNIHLGQHLKVGGPALFLLEPLPVAHDSAIGSADQNLELKTLATNLWRSTGICELIAQTRNDWTLGIGRVLMIGVGVLLLYLAIGKNFEPLLLVPIGFGAIMTNIPHANLAGPDGILGMVYHVGVETGVFPLLIFMGVGAMTDFGPLIANPMTALLGAAAQMGIFVALLGALALSQWVPGIDFSLRDAASIGIIGGADGPTAIFLAGRLSPSLLGAIAVAAYSYMALVPIIQPPLMRFFTTVEERKVRMAQLRYVSPLEKICFPVSITLLCALLLPDAAPLISMLMFGNLLRECGVVDRLSNTAQNALINIVTIFLGLTVGSKLSADKFLNLQTVGILVLGLVAFMIGTVSGVLLGKIMHRLTGGKVNPLIGAAGVSAVPMAARVVNKVGLEDDPHNFLLMHAMGPNVAGVIGSAVAAGVLLNALKLLN